MRPPFHVVEHGRPGCAGLLASRRQVTYGGQDDRGPAPAGRPCSILSVRDSRKPQSPAVDSIPAIALSSQVTAWQVRDTVEARAQRGTLSDLRTIPATVPDVPAAAGDEKITAAPR